MEEIAFILNPEVSLAKDCLVLDLAVAVREGRALSLKEVHEKRLTAYWQALAHAPADKESFAFLLKQDPLFQQRAINQLHIPSSQVHAALKLLAPTQKLFCEGKQLVIDLFGPAEFFYEATPLEKEKLEIRGKLKWRDTVVDLAKCQAIIPGKPVGFVHGLMLKLVGTSFNWKRFKELKLAPLVLEGGAKQTFLENLDPDDPDEPKLIFTQGSIEEATQSSQPLPLLILKDRWGACADLWMDYGHGRRIALHDLKRQKESESSWEKDLLETDFVKKSVGTSHYYCPLNLVSKSLTFLLEIGWRIEDWQGREVVRQTQLALQFDERANAIAIKGHLAYGNHQADVSQVLGAFNRREHFIEISPHSIGLLPIGEAGEALRDLSEESEMIGEERVIQKSHLGAIEHVWQYATSSERLQDLKNRLQDFKGIQVAPPSDQFKGHLRPYQQEGVNWLSFLFDYNFHGILADEMGLGKTVQVLAFLSRLPKEGKHLIVMPTSLLFNWRNEIHQFLPHISCIIHQGAERAKTVEELEKCSVILTSYTTLRLDLLLLKSLSYETVILDEAQMIKNANTQTSQAVCQLSARLRICITGTPVENRLQELWSHFRFLMPDLFGPQEAFEAEIQAGESDRRYLNRIKRKIAPFLLRRRKTDVLKDLPPRIDQVIWIEMAEEQRREYDQMLAKFKGGLLKKVELEGVGKCRMEILEALLRLRQMCCHPLLVSSFFGEDTPASAKFDALMEDLETICEEGHKVLVYSQFTSMLKIMAQEAQKRSWSYGYLDGSTVNREAVVKEFQENSSQNLFFISLKAGGVGLNLTAADYVYLYDPWWNEAVEEQAINRAHRIGRKDVVISKRFAIAESIEEKMMKLKAAKRTIIDDLMNEENLSSNLSLEDLQFLLT